MAVISEKNIRRYRVQFTMSRLLYQTYQHCLEKADDLQVLLDFSRDFERWFAGQLEQVERELDRRLAEQAKETQPTRKEVSHGESN